MGKELFERSVEAMKKAYKDAGIDRSKMSEEEKVRFDKKKRETFRAVRDTLRESGNAWAYNMCFHTPWYFYGTHSADECVKILLDNYKA